MRANARVGVPDPVDLDDVDGLESHADVHRDYIQAAILVVALNDPDELVVARILLATLCVYSAASPPMSASSRSEA